MGECLSLRLAVGALEDIGNTVVVGVDVILLGQGAEELIAA